MKKYIDTIIHGDCLDTVKQFPDKSINCVITSPPYWQLRDYGWTGQWGLEKTYTEYLEHLWQLMDEICRVLKDDGTVWVNLGDTFGTQSGSMGRGGCDPKNPVASNTIFEQSKSIHKCLLLIPHRFAIGCIDRGWIVRNDIIWAKRNGMPESVTDRFSKKHEYFFFMVKSEKYYFDLDGVRDKHISSNKTRVLPSGSQSWSRETGQRGNSGGVGYCELGKNPGSVSDFWDIPTQPSNEKHYATFNTKLIDKPIIAGCTEGGIILDPFAGTATTLYRAKELKRNYVGIEGNAEYCTIAENRLRILEMQPQLL